MTKVETIEEQIKKLSPDEQVDLRRWFLAFDAEAWDREIEADVKEGRLDALAEEALKEHKEGKSTPL